ncbi:MAG: acyl-CoA dehydrogenase [Halobacteriales archaeon SW_9_67_24]|nr:MAG: acyl-CoA dehydrogenase [Halobacteriales archaeon SW_9_67_24]
MSFQLSDEQEAIRSAVREFAEEEIAPVAREHDESGEYPADLRREAAEYDFVAPNIPTEYGGAGMVNNGNSNADSGRTTIASTPVGSAVCAQQSSASAISEPAHGSNVAGIETRAEKDGDEYVLNGNKMWITNGTVADIAVVMTKTDPGAGHQGITAFLVPTDTEGFSTETIDNKLGIRASDLAEVLLDDVRVPEKNVVGEVNQGFYQLMDFFAAGRTSVAAQAVGAAQGALDAAREYAGEREQFDQPIAEFQAIRHKLAEMATNADAARSLTYRAATHVEAGDDNAVRFASMAKLFASEHAVDVADEAIQVFGGAGYVTDHPAERYYRDARITKIYEGTSEIQKNIIADRLL